MLTKGDVLFALGKTKDARGTAGKLGVTKYGVSGMKFNESISTTPPAGPKEPELILDGAAFRRLILGGLEKATQTVRPISSATNPLTASTPTPSTSISAQDFESALSPYASLFVVDRKPKTELPGVEALVEQKRERVQERDEWEGLF